MAATASSPTLPYLPSEILSTVFTHNSKTDLQNIRLGCREFNAVATPLVFNELTLRLDMTFDEYSQRPPFTFGTHVKSLTVLTADYELQPNEGQQYLQKIFDDCAGNNVIYDAAAGRESFERYGKLQARHSAALEAGEMLVYLVMLLSSMPNLRNICLSDQVCRPSGSDRLINGACVPESHDPYAIFPSSGLLDLGKVHWRILITALSIHQLQPSELVVTSNFPATALHIVAFDTTPVQLQRTANIFIGLKKLHLSVMLDGDTWGVAGHNLNWLLSQAIHLQVLSISNIFEEIILCKLIKLLGQCRFPALRSLILDAFTSTEEDLLQLVLASKHLEHLHLVFFHLRSGSWESVAEALKDGLPYLKDVRMTLLAGPERDDPVFGDWYIDSFGRVQMYFRNRGSNPFCGDGMLRAREEQEALPKESYGRIYRKACGIDAYSLRR
ncbi:MAG: hypothetical protein Q9186_003363 [Xanthomendoza sp. 1 TL-2023]